MGLLYGKLVLAMIKIAIVPVLILIGGALTDLLVLNSTIYLGAGTIIGLLIAGLMLILLQQVFSASLRDSTTVDCLDQ